MLTEKPGPKALLHWKSSFQPTAKLGKPWLLVTILAPALQRTGLPAPVCLLEYQCMCIFGYTGSQSSGGCTLTTFNSCRQVCWRNDIEPRVWHINFQRHRESQNKTLTYCPVSIVENDIFTLKPSSNQTLFTASLQWLFDIHWVCSIFGTKPSISMLPPNCQAH